MALRKGTPGKGGGIRPDTFSYTSVGSGLKSAFTGWLAGEPYWCEEAHEHTDKDRGTKPCLYWLTEGALRCKRCASGRQTRCIGWVPIYREVDHKPIVVIVHESAAELLADLSYPDHVLVGRVDAKSSVFVRKSDSAVSFRTENEQRSRPVDITRDLLSMWQIPDLDHWLKQGSPPAQIKCEPVDGEKRWRLSVPPPTTRTERLAADAHRTVGADGASGVDDALSRVIRRAGQQSGNGKHGSDEGG